LLEKAKMNNTGIKNTFGRGEENPLSESLTNKQPIANTAKIHYLSHTQSISSVKKATIEMADPTREEIGARIEASEARNDTKIARLESKIDLVLSKLDAAKSDSLAIRTNQWVIAFGLALLIVAVVALFPVFFGIGTQVRDMVDSAVQSHLQRGEKP
jgi:Fe2+ transport system protein B